MYYVILEGGWRFIGPIRVLRIIYTRVSSSHTHMEGGVSVME